MILFVLMCVTLEVKSVVIGLLKSLWAMLIDN
jgi:hypothetical protein